MRNQTKQKLPNGKLKELASRANLNYVRASRLSAGMVSPTRLEDYAFMKELKSYWSAIAQAKAEFEKNVAS